MEKSNIIEIKTLDEYVIITLENLNKIKFKKHNFDKVYVDLVLSPEGQSKQYNLNALKRIAYVRDEN